MKHELSNLRYKSREENHTFTDRNTKEKGLIGKQILWKARLRIVADKNEEKHKK